MPDLHGAAIYTPSEVAQHNSPADCWVSFRGRVFDVTALIQDHSGQLIEPLLEAAGKDISDWFDPHLPEAHLGECTGTETEQPEPCCRQGKCGHVESPAGPAAAEGDAGGSEVPWWLGDARYCRGRLAARTRRLRLRNTLTGQEDLLEVPAEETLGQVRRRYGQLNSHARSYIFKALRPGALDFEELSMDRTLSENGVVDVPAELAALGVSGDPEDVPVVLLDYCDDLTEQ